MARPPEIPAARGAGGSHGSPWRAAGVAIVAALALGGSGLIAVAVSTEPEAPPQPPAEAAPGDLASLLAEPPGADPDGAGTPGPTSTALPAPPGPGGATASGGPPNPGGTAAPGGTANPGGAPTPGPAATPKPTGPVPLARAEPIGIRIPKIGVRAKTQSLGLDREGMVQVPSLDQAQDAGWFNLGPSPGEAGAALIVGHVDSHKTGPAVFFKLGALRPGDKITVNRKDGKDATFVVDAVKSFPKTAFPTDLVYARTALPTLRVVTCGGRFDAKTGNYPDNIIVFATMAATPQM
nr:class F sortase [Micromonospora sp. DSM 115978]